MSSLDQPLDRPRVPRALEMIGHRVGVGRWLRHYHLGDVAVEGAATGEGDRLIERLADEGVGEADPGSVWRFQQHPRSRRAVNRVRQRLLVGRGYPQPEIERHRLANDRRQGQELPDLRAEPRRPRPDDLAQEGRHARPG